MNEEDCKQCRRKSEEVRQLVRAYYTDLREVMRTMESLKVRLEYLDEVPKLKARLEILEAKMKKK